MLLTHLRAKRTLLVLSAAILTLAMITNAFIDIHRAGATTTSGYSQSISVPAPPSGSFSGSTGADGYMVATTSTQIFQVPHCVTISGNDTCGEQLGLRVYCLERSTGNACSNYPITVTGNNGDTLSPSGQTPVWIDQSTGYLYTWSMDTTTSEVGVMCINTNSPSSPSCGFTPMGETDDPGAMAQVGSAAMVGSNWYAPFASTTAEAMLCFDVATQQPCANQPYEWEGTNSDASLFGASEIINGSTIFVGAEFSFNPNPPEDMVTCFDTTINAPCTTGSFPETISSLSAQSLSTNGLVPILSAGGVLTGMCLITGNCYDTTGATISEPSVLTSALSGVTSASYEASSPVIIGSRAYIDVVPTETGASSVGEAICIDYATNSACQGFPLSFGSNAGVPYSLTTSPIDPTCLWMTADNGSALIQSFDAFTGGACGSSGTRISMSQFVVPTTTCAPSSYGTLTITSPSTSAYSSGTVEFEDADGNQLGTTQTLSAQGTLDLSSLSFLPSGLPLPQMLITLTGATSDPITATMTWNATSDSSCTADGQILTASTTTTPTTTTPTTTTPTTTTPTTTTPTTTTPTTTTPTTTTPTTTTPTTTTPTTTTPTTTTPTTTTPTSSTASNSRGSSSPTTNKGSTTTTPSTLATTGAEFTWLAIFAGGGVIAGLLAIVGSRRRKRVS